MIHDMEVDLSGIFTENSLDAMLRVESVENDRTDFIAAYGGLFFLGILLSVAFILAAVLIIYFKQISRRLRGQIPLRHYAEGGTYRQGNPVQHQFPASGGSFSCRFYLPVCTCALPSR